MRAVKTLIVMSALLAAAIIFNPFANADKDTYLQWLASHGVVGDGAQYGEDFALQTGNNACAAIKEGKSDSFLMSQLIEAYEMGKAQAGDFVYAAHNFLCPST